MTTKSNGERLRHRVACGHRATTLSVVAAVVLLALSVSAGIVAAQADAQPTGFEFYFNGPGRGLRVWHRSGDVWTETYPSGQEGKFRVRKAPFHVQGMTGTIVGKVDEPDFFVFIPNLYSRKMEVWTHKGAGPWRFLARMRDVMPVRID
jgi:hypothetical protein